MGISMPRLDAGQRVLLTLCHRLTAGRQPKLLGPHQFYQQPALVATAAPDLLDLGNQISCHGDLCLATPGTALMDWAN